MPGRSCSARSGSPRRRPIRKSRHGVESIRVPGLKAFDAANFAWAVTEDGINNGCCLLKLTPADMVKIGGCLDRGQWEGRQILPAEWVEQATTPSETTATTACSGGWNTRRTSRLRRRGAGRTTDRRGARDSDGDHGQHHTHRGSRTGTRRRHLHDQYSDHSSTALTLLDPPVAAARQDSQPTAEHPIHLPENQARAEDLGLDRRCSGDIPDRAPLFPGSRAHPTHAAGADTSTT